MGNPITNRLALVIIETGKSQTAFAKDADVSQSNLSKMLNQVYPVSPKMIDYVCGKLNYSTDWFLKGTGPKKAINESERLLNKMKDLEQRIKAQEEVINDLIQFINNRIGEFKPGKKTHKGNLEIESSGGSVKA